MASDSRVTGSDDVQRPDQGKRPEDGAPSQADAKRPTSRKKKRAASRENGDQNKQNKQSEPSDAPAGGEKTPDRDKPAAGKRSKPHAAPPGGESPTGQTPPVDPSAKAKVAAARQANGVGLEEPDDASREGEETGPRHVFGANRFLLFNAVPSWLISMLVHAALLMILALMTLPEKSPDRNIVAVANPDDMEEIEDLESQEIDPMDVDTFENETPIDDADTSTTRDVVDVPSLDDLSAAPDQFKIEDFGDMSALSDDLIDQVGGGMDQGLGEARGAKARAGAVNKYGGNAASEAAVAAALKWLSLHQQRDGGWSFNHHQGPCKGRCPNPGLILPARNAATAMALLPFLGAGQTHKEGAYQENVERGLAFLVRQMKPRGAMGDLTDSGGKMYSHGLSSIVLCEAYAMTNDPGLLQPAQMALNFIVYAQDPVGGGWRYQPKQPGDTSVVGWQLMACKSGHMGYLKVPRRTILGVNKFLDFVQDEGGARYGYTVPAAGKATTAVGLLCRMYLGWKKDEPALKAGVEFLHQQGPGSNMYYNYYATQVMRHYGGEYWKTWNSKLRDQLVKTQDKKGHAKGSWYIQGAPQRDKGGRLYCTSMATMILEVYYRHLPIYGKQAAEEDFPL